MTSTTSEQPGNGNAAYKLIIQDLCRKVEDAVGQELRKKGQPINEKLLQKTCTTAIEYRLAPALCDWVGSTIPEPDETGCSESIITREGISDVLHRMTQNLETTRLGEIVHEAVAVLENFSPDDMHEFMNHTPEPGFYDHLIGLL